jgi:hypothetical protein
MNMKKIMHSQSKLSRLLLVLLSCLFVYQFGMSQEIKYLIKYPGVLSILGEYKWLNTRNICMGPFDSINDPPTAKFHLKNDLLGNKAIFQVDATVQTSTMIGSVKYWYRNLSGVNYGIYPIFFLTSKKIVILPPAEWKDLIDCNHWKKC